MLKLIFRILLTGLAIFIFYSFGIGLGKTVWYRMNGTVVEGRVSGFLAGRNSPSVQMEPTGVRNGKLKARRPVYTYPVAENATDSLTSRSGIGTLFTFSQFSLNERVTVVFDPDNPGDSYIFSGGLLLSSLLLILFGLYVLYMGVVGKS